MDNLIISLNTSLPVFIIVITGIFFKRAGFINDNFIEKSNLIVFNAALPSLIFIRILSADFKSVFSSSVIIFGCSATFIFFLLAWIIAWFTIKDGKTIGAFVQGAFRSNVAIIGLALVNNLFGASGVAKGAIMISFLMPLYTVLSVVALTVPVHKKGASIIAIVKAIITNPLILAVILSVPFTYFSIDIPFVVKQSIVMLSDITLPLALLSIGASLNFRSIRKKFMPAFISSFIKLAGMPYTATAAAAYYGLRGESLGILFITLSSPAAVSSYIMAKAMDSDDELAGYIVLITTLGAIFTISGGIFILKLLELI